ncbi:hypothetical protein ANCCAN_01945 [Ancylostoma caninum]|uniref:E3 SUMO-protein ligase NSE2 n=1 Tax=Ancylostoma caninum TaxID=29170 RepID=A0A368H971_ANCCA|nr:hypothetical protein ANCCAN_01945 [Ancylostoma caninum]
MLRDIDVEVLDRGLQDALKVLKDTPLFEEAEESYKKAIEEAAKIDVQLAKDDDVLRSMHEKAQNGVAFRIEKLRKQYQDGCSKSDATGAMAGIIANLRSRIPQPLVSETPSEQVVANDAADGEDMTIVEVVRSHKDPLGGGLIKDPVKSKYCGHVYDRTTLQQYIDDNRARRIACYQCPYSLCRSKKNMDMRDMVDCPEFLLS